MPDAKLSGARSQEPGSQLRRHKQSLPFLTSENERVMNPKNEEDERYMRLEERLLSEVNRLGIGAGGLGGNNTCLSVAIETYPTHIAGLPVALSVNCWADRKAFISIMDEEVL